MIRAFPLRSPCAGCNFFILPGALLWTSGWLLACLSSWPSWRQPHLTPFLVCRVEAFLSLRCKDLSGRFLRGQIGQTFLRHVPRSCQRPFPCFPSCSRQSFPATFLPKTMREQKRGRTKPRIPRADKKLCVEAPIVSYPILYYTVLIYTILY